MSNNIIPHFHFTNSISLGLLMAFPMLGIIGCSHKKESQPSISKVEVDSPIVTNVTISNPYPATLESESRAEVVAQVNGRLLKVHFSEGSYVRKGDVLFTIEPTNYITAVNQAKAQVASARSQLDYADQHLKALENALEAEAVAEMDVAQAKSAKAQAQATVNQALANLEAQNVKIGYCTVRAPISGKISSASLDVGAYISGEGSPVLLATIYDDSKIDVTFTIPEYEFASISSAGNGFADSLYRAVPVIVISTPEISPSAPKYLADIFYESPSVDTSTGSIRIKGRITGEAGGLRDGMYARVSLPVAEEPHGILVRDASISTDQRGKYLYTVNDSNIVVYTPITVGALYQDSLRLVTDGIKPGQKYVTKAIMNVRAGEKVEPVEAHKNSPR